MLGFMPNEDKEEMREEIKAHKDVWKVQYVDSGRARIDGIDAGVIVMDDFAGKETVNIYQGIFPRYENEIAIAGLIANMLSKEIGDEVLVGKDELPYIITGLTQGMETGPLTVYLTLEGMRRVTPGFSQFVLMVYLNKGVDAVDFLEEMETGYGGRLVTAVDADSSFAEGVSSFASIMSLVGLAIIIVAGLIVILVLYFVIGSTIIRRRRELGIQKAIGYTTGNLMNQISLGFVFPLTLGAAAGCALGAVATNPLMSLGMASFGVMKASFLINPVWVFVTGCIMVLLSYLTSMLITWRIRKISAYALVTE
jgi:putative ABC transport system permease protein